MGAFAYLCTALGMAPLLALFRRDGAAVLFESASGSPYASRLGYFLFLGLACVGAATWFYLCTHNAAVRARQSDRRLVVAVSAATTAVAEVYLLLGGVDGAGVLGVVAASAALAAWAAITVPCWGEALATYGRKTILLCMVLALLASLIPSTAGAFVEGALKQLVVAGPLLSGALFVLAFRPQGAPAPQPIPPATATAESPSAPSPTEPSVPKDTITVELRRFPLFFAALVLLGGVIRGFLNNGTFINSHDPASNLTTHVVSAALVVCVFCIAARCEKTSLGMRRAGASLFAFLLGSLLLIAFLSVELEPLVPLGRSLVIAANTCLTVLFWALLVCLQREEPSRSPAHLELYVVVEALASVCSYLLTPSFAQYLGVSLQNQVFGCSLATAFVLAIATFAFLGNGLLPGAAPEPAAPPPQRSPLDACQDLAAAHGLTEREVQICALIAQGHTLDAVADRLGLSANTVRSYSKDLYRKLGVHKKQEVVELVAQAIEEQPR